MWSALTSSKSPVQTEFVINFVFSKTKFPPQLTPYRRNEHTNVLNLARE